MRNFAIIYERMKQVFAMLTSNVCFEIVMFCFTTLQLNETSTQLFQTLYFRIQILRNRNVQVLAESVYRKQSNIMKFCFSADLREKQRRRHENPLLIWTRRHCCTTIEQSFCTIAQFYVWTKHVADNIFTPWFWVPAIGERPKPEFCILPG